MANGFVRALMAICALVICSSSALAQKKAEEILWECKSPSEDAPAEQRLRFLSCISYVDGAHDMLRMLSDGLELRIICTPKAGLSTDQTVRIVLKWIEQHPERMHQTARVAVFSALQEAFPCKPKTDRK